MDRRSFLRGERGLAKPYPAGTPATQGDNRPPLGTLSLAEKLKVLSADQLRHLYRRTGFGISRAQLLAGAGSACGPLVDELMETAINQPPIADPPWPMTWDGKVNNERMRELRNDWLKHIYQRGLREKLTLFWTDHFVTEYDNQPVFTWRYLKRIRRLAMGNFKDFVHEMGRDQEMLRYLSGTYNEKAFPNDNYARELLELFTMGRTNSAGQPNYSEQDVVEVARALTGWVTGGEEDLSGILVGYRFDDGVKTIFGQTGAWDYDDLINLLFEQRGREVAEYICTKLYQHFVYEVPNPVIIDRMADTFQASDYEIVPVLTELFKSQHFYQTAAIGSRIKSPVEVYFGMCHEADFEMTFDPWLGTCRYVYEACAAVGQQLLDPDDVSGWFGFRGWISSVSIPKRIKGLHKVLDGTIDFLMPQQNLVEWVREMTGNSADPAVIVQAVATHVFAKPISAMELGRLEIAFKGDIPQNEYDDGQWDLDREEAPEQIRVLMREIYALPEYQLM